MTQRGAMIITWADQRPGVPPEQGLGVFGKALEYYDGLAKAGRIDGYRVYSSLQRERGMLVIEGEVSTLAQILTEQESIKQFVLGSAVIQDLQVDLCVGGSADDVSQFYATGMQAIADAGITTA
jgi:hypothetical protein